MGKGPRRINFVTLLFIATAVFVVYCAVKFVPVYLDASNVETILDEARYDASKLGDFAGQGRVDRVLDGVRDKILALGVEDELLDVYFDDEMESLHADFTVVVHHPFGMSTELEFERSVAIERKE